MKKILTGALALGFLASPILASAAYNDVTLTTDTIITVGSINLNVSGSSATVTSVTVGATNFSFILNSGSTMTITSPDRYELAYDIDINGPYLKSRTCSATESTLQFSSSNTSSATTITITPSTSSCGPAPTTSSTSSRGRSSSGGSAAASVPAVASPAVASPAVASASTTFTKDLTVGSSGAEVTALQNALNVSPATGYFGSITKAAVIAYQKANGVPGTGFVGPLTRASLNKSAAPVATSGTTPVVTSVVSANVVKVTTAPNSLKKGVTSSEVESLQTKLAKDKTVYPEGLTTGFFGSLTEKAVQRFQAKYGIVSSGTPATTGYGQVGPKTKAKIAEVFGQ